MLQYSTTLNKDRMAAMKTALDSGFLFIFASSTGLPPASADVALDMVSTHTLLGKVSANAGGGTGLTFATPTGNILTKTSSETWSTGNMTFSGAQATGGTDTLTACFYRFCAAGDNGQGADSGSTPRIQGTIGTDISHDMVVPTASFVEGTNFTLNAEQIQGGNV